VDENPGIALCGRGLASSGLLFYPSKLRLSAENGMRVATSDEVVALLVRGKL
jgi:hypothetical protein